ncbi:MAG: acyl-CoA thioesterase [Rhizobacter sp.]|nr:acyl-CoA thioesterase [Rhizobacter sp.]
MHPSRISWLALLLMPLAAAAATVSAQRPQLSDAQAPNYTKAKYLARSGAIGSPSTDNWNPSGAGDVSTFSARYTVAADGTGTHSTVQAAINAASGTARVYIAIKPGTYRGVTCVPSSKPPITLYSTNTDASKTVLVYNNYAGKSKSSSTAANPCNPQTGSTSYGTIGSATFTVAARDFHAKNLTFANDFNEGSSSSNVQAVALMTTGDKLVFDNVRVLGNQDTLFLSTPGYSTIARSYFKSSYVQGDVDFIFGRGTAVFESCTIKYLSTRWGNNGNHIAPATAAGNAYGFLFSGSHFTKDSSTGSNVISLGRSWDEGVSTGAYIAGSSPNGQAVIRESTLDSHIKLQAPWGTSTSGRAFSASGNRLREYKNTGGGS